MSGEFERENEEGVVVQESDPELEDPHLYKVILMNDDFTPMDFVVQILERFFSMDRHAATKVMVQVHTQGKGICGIYSYEIAETKVDLVNHFSRENQHPLLCTLEKA